jgi:hypothetical protein
LESIFYFESQSTTGLHLSGNEQPRNISNQVTVIMKAWF